MKVALIIYVVYESVFFKVAHTSLSVETFETYEECRAVKAEAVDIIRETTEDIDELIAKCKAI